MGRRVSGTINPIFWNSVLSRAMSAGLKALSGLPYEIDCTFGAFGVEVTFKTQAAYQQ